MREYVADDDDLQHAVEIQEEYRQIPSVTENYSALVGKPTGALQLQSNIGVVAQGEIVRTQVKGGENFAGGLNLTLAFVANSAAGIPVAAYTTLTSLRAELHFGSGAGLFHSGPLPFIHGTTFSVPGSYISANIIQASAGLINSRVSGIVTIAATHISQGIIHSQSLPALPVLGVLTVIREPFAQSIMITSGDVSNQQLLLEIYNPAATIVVASLEMGPGAMPFWLRFPSDVGIINITNNGAVAVPVTVNQKVVF